MLVYWVLLVLSYRCIFYLVIGDEKVAYRLELWWISS